jgi:hypothetical protein
MKAIDKEKVVKLLKKYALDHSHLDLYKDSEDLAEQIINCKISFDMDKGSFEHSVRKRPRTNK